MPTISRSTVSHHLLANIVGRSWAFLSTLLFVPAYIYILGLESYGVIALFMAVSGIVAILDLGLSPTLANELQNQQRTTAKKLDVLFTYEVIYWVILACAIVLAAVAPKGWLALVVSAEDLARPEVSASVRWVFIAAATQMWFNFYVAGLLGADQQVKGNVVIVACGIVRNGLVLIPLALYPTPFTFLIWQVIFVVIFAGIARYLLYSSVRGELAGLKRTLDLRTVAGNIGFTSGMFVVSITAAINAQLDKLVIGRTAGVETLGEYSLVSSFGQLLVFFVSPVAITLLPRFVRSASLGETQEMRQLYALMLRLVAAIVCAAAASMAVFGPYLVSLWSVGRVDPGSVSQYIVPLVAGYALLALGTAPHSVAVANRRLKASLAIALTVPFTIPAYWYSIREFGLPGAATTWLLLQAVVVPLYMIWVNRNLVSDFGLGRLVALTFFVLLPVSITICLAASLLLSERHHFSANLGIVLLAAIASLAACFLISIRRVDLGYLTRSSGPVNT